MDFMAVIVRSIAGAGLLTLVGSSVATAIPSFERSTRVELGTATGGLVVRTGEPVPDEDRDDLKEPKTLTKLVVKLPAGTRYTPRGEPACSRDRAVSDDCPKGSLVGNTVLHLIYTAPDPRFRPAGCRTRGDIYHGRRRLILESTPSVFCTGLDRGVTTLFEAHFDKPGPVITIDNPDGPVNYFVLRLKSRELVHAPGRCPRSGRWATRVTARYDDGTKESVVTRQRCRRS